MLIEAEPWTPDRDMHRVSVSVADEEMGCPRNGDMIAHNLERDEYYLINKLEFERTYRLADERARAAFAYDYPHLAHYVGQ